MFQKRLKIGNKRQRGIMTDNLRNIVLLLWSVVMVYSCDTLSAQKETHLILDKLLENSIDIDTLVMKISPKKRLVLIDSLIQRLKKEDDGFNCNWNVVLNDSIKEENEARGNPFSLIEDIPPKKIVIMYLVEKLFVGGSKEYNYLEVYSVVKNTPDSIFTKREFFFTCTTDKIRKYEDCSKTLSEINCKPNKKVIRILQKHYIAWYEELKNKGLKVLSDAGITPLSKSNYQWRNELIDKLLIKKRDSFFSNFRK